MKDRILSSYPLTKKGRVYELTPLEDRENELEQRRLGKLHDIKWIYERLRLGARGLSAKVFIGGTSK